MYLFCLWSIIISALWFLVRWEDGNHTPVPRKAIQAVDVPVCGDTVLVKDEKGIYEGEVIYKGF